MTQSYMLDVVNWSKTAAIQIMFPSDAKESIEECPHVGTRHDGKSLKVRIRRLDTPCMLTGWDESPFSLRLVCKKACG